MNLMNCRNIVRATGLWLSWIDGLYSDLIQLGQSLLDGECEKGNHEFRRARF
jgi:hypothetical protein